MRKFIPELASLTFIFTLPLLLAVSGGKEGGGTALNPDAAPVEGELIYYDSSGKLSTVHGTHVDAATGHVEFTSIESTESTLNDINAMGTPTNNTTDNTNKNCSTSDSTLSDNKFRILDIDAGGSTGVPGDEVIEQCVGKTEALDERQWYWSNTGMNASSALRAIGINSPNVQNITQHAMIESYPFATDATTGAYKKLFLKDMTCTLEVATGFEDGAGGECIEVQVNACDVDGGIVGTGDCTTINQFRFGWNASNDCTAPQDVNCSATIPCKGTKTIDTVYDVANLTVTTGGGNPDILLLGFNKDATAFTADDTTALSPVNIQCTIRGAN